MDPRLSIRAGRIPLEPAALLASLALAACGGGSDVAAPQVGAIEIVTSTSGPGPDADGYGVTLDSASQGSVPSNGRLTIPSVAAGEHRVGLSSASVAPNCSVAGANPLAATVQAAETTHVTFAVACSPAGTPPVITEVRAPDAIDNAPGTFSDFTIGYADPDGDVAGLTIVALSDPGDAVDPDSVEVDLRTKTMGQAAGEVVYRHTCTATSPNLCGAGPVSLRFQLIDAAGNRSEPRALDLHFGIGTSPQITAVDAPANSGTARGTRTRIRVGFSDPEGDVRKVRLEELSDTSDAIDATREVDVSAQAGTKTSATVTLDFVCRVAVGRACPAGAATVRLELIDAESNSSRPADVTIVFGPTGGGGSPPTITTFEIPATVSTAAGTRADFVLGFADPDGDVTTLRIQEVSDPSSAFPGDVDLDVLPQADGRDSGTVTTTLACNLPLGSQCPAGRVTLRYTLLDARGNASAPREATTEFVSPGASTSTRGSGAFTIRAAQERPARSRRGRAVPTTH